MQTANTQSKPKSEEQLISAGCLQLDAKSLWSGLPEEVIERILLCLPVASTVQFRTVCTKWKSLFLSDAYWRKRYRMDQDQEVKRSAWFFVCTIGKFSCAFDFEMDRWHKIPNPSIPRMSIITAAGGILCLGNLVADCKMLSICNPIKKTVKQLPPTSRIQLIHKASMCVNKDAQSFKIVVAGEENSIISAPINSRVYNLYTEIYDSSAGHWRMAGNPLPHAKFGSDPGVWCNGLFYCITELPYGVVRFDAENGVWSELDAAMPCSVSTPVLAESNGRLIMVGRVVNNVHKTIEKIQIWELQFMGSDIKVWTELQQMPPSIYSEFMAPLKFYSPLICSAIGDWLCIHTHLTPRALAFNLSNNTWKYLPTDPLFPGNRNFRLLGLCYKPAVSDCHI